MSSEASFKFTRQSSWEMFSAAAQRELVPPQFASQLQHLAYNDKYVIHFDFGHVGKPSPSCKHGSRANAGQTTTRRPKTSPSS